MKDSEKYQYGIQNSQFNLVFITTGYIVIIAMIVWKPTLGKHAKTDYANVIHAWKDIPEWCSSQTLKIVCLMKPVVIRVNQSELMWL